MPGQGKAELKPRSDLYQTFTPEAFSHSFFKIFNIVPIDISSKSIQRRSGFRCGTTFGLIENFFETKITHTRRSSANLAKRETWTSVSELPWYRYRKSFRKRNREYILRNNALDPARNPLPMSQGDHKSNRRWCSLWRMGMYHLVVCANLWQLSPLVPNPNRYFIGPQEMWSPGKSRKKSWSW
jgi:hypothetical protein